MNNNKEKNDLIFLITLTVWIKDGVSCCSYSDLVNKLNISHITKRANFMDYFIPTIWVKICWTYFDLQIEINFLSLSSSFLFAFDLSQQHLSMRLLLMNIEIEFGRFLIFVSAMYSFWKRKRVLFDFYFF